MHRSPFLQYGANILILDKNLTAKSIENFVTSNAEPVGPILEMTDQNFQNVIDKRLLVFVIFCMFNLIPY